MSKKSGGPAVPSGLEQGGRTLWSSVVDRYELRPDELRTLEDACREADLVDGLRDALAESTYMIEGSQGQLVINPLVSEVRQHRMVLRSLMAALKLPEEGRADGAGERSSQARAAAQARWSRRGA